MTDNIEKLIKQREDAIQTYLTTEDHLIDIFTKRIEALQEKILKHELKNTFLCIQNLEDNDIYIFPDKLVIIGDTENFPGSVMSYEEYIEQLTDPKGPLNIACTPRDYIVPFVENGRAMEVYKCIKKTERKIYKAIAKQESKIVWHPAYDLNVVFEERKDDWMDLAEAITEHDGI